MNKCLSMFGMQPLSIIVDNRERNNALIEGLLGMDIRLSFLQLPVGDYIISDRMCVERKTARDFELSIIDARLFEQAERLGKSFLKPILILEGESDEPLLKRNAVLGAVSRLYADYNILVMPSRDAEETAYLLSRLADMEQRSEGREPRLVGRKKAYSFYQNQSIVLCSIPGIGPKLSLLLLRRFGSIKEIANASIEELAGVDKVGPKKARSIHNIFNMDSDGR